MTWGIVGSIGGAVVGGLIQSDGSRKAANIQGDAAREANALSKEQYDATVARNAPFVSGGTTSFNALLDRLGLSGNTSAAGYGSFGKVPTAQDVMSEPGYQFGLQQGQQQIDRAMNARGMAGSGAQVKAAARFGTDYASGQYNNAFNRSQSAQQQAFNQLGNVATMGQNAANNTGTAGASFAAGAGKNMIGAAGEQAANAIAQGNVWGNVLNQGVSAYKNRPQGAAGGNIWAPGYDDVNAMYGGWTGDH